MTLASRIAAVVACAWLAAGCGFGEGEDLEGDPAEIRVTRDFGADTLASNRFGEVHEGDTVMRLLRSRHEIDTRYGDRFVQAIDGLSGSPGSAPRDWFYFVNGIWADRSAADFDVHPGDVVQWDHRRWDGANVLAIVGAYPEPFVHGTDGKRIPVRVECERDDSDPCREVKRRLADDGVTASGAPLGATAGDEVLRVVVGRWDAVRKVQVLSLLGEDAGRSGVFARFRGDRLELLEASGSRARTAPPGTGLVAATRFPGQLPVWAVTGVDDAGVGRAAEALEPRVLRDAFAVAATPDGPLDLPVRGGSR